MRLALYTLILVSWACLWIGGYLLVGYLMLQGAWVVLETNSVIAMQIYIAFGLLIGLLLINGGAVRRYEDLMTTLGDKLLHFAAEKLEID